MAFKPDPTRQQKTAPVGTGAAASAPMLVGTFTGGETGRLTRGRCHPSGRGAAWGGTPGCAPWLSVTSPHSAKGSTKGDAQVDGALHLGQQHRVEQSNGVIHVIDTVLLPKM